MNALVVIETLTPAIFSEDGGIDAMLSRLEAEVRSVKTDVSTPKGRKEIASLAFKVARSKTAFDEMGAELVADWKKQAKVVDQERARVWDRLEALQAEVRKPLDDYEADEAKRIADHQSALQSIIDLGAFASDMPASADVIAALSAFDEIPERDWQEFKQKFGAARSETFAKLQAFKGAALAREAEVAELARLRAEQAAREQKEREDRIAAEASAAATKAAEEKAARDAKAAADLAEAERLRLDREKVEAIAAQKRAEAATLKAKEGAGRERVAMEVAAENGRLIAIDNERRRVAEAAEAEDRETARRQADKVHKKAINTAALDALIAIGLTPKQGTDVIVAIYRGDIPNVTINY